MRNKATQATPLSREHLKVVSDEESLVSLCRNNLQNHSASLTMKTLYVFITKIVSTYISKPVCSSTDSLTKAFQENVPCIRNFKAFIGFTSTI